MLRATVPAQERLPVADAGEGVSEVADGAGILQAVERAACGKKGQTIECILYETLMSLLAFCSSPHIVIERQPFLPDNLFCTRD